MDFENRGELMEQKFSFTNRKMIYEGRTLFEIVATRKFVIAEGTSEQRIIKVGDVGGWLESSANLDRNGHSWVLPGCIVCDNALVRDNAVLIDNSIAQDAALVYGDAIVCRSGVYDRGRVGDHASVRNAAIYHDASVTGAVMLAGEARFAPDDGRFPVKTNARIIVAGFTSLSGHTVICGTGEVVPR